ncbi:MAG: ABC transporter substrate-binding protein [Clostridia bacterium]|nr:ABC transporter substrate-binding protein [Clostridia bacterium]
MKRLASVYLIVITLLICGQCRAYDNDPIYTRLTVPLLFSTEISPDVEMINEAVNVITREKIGAEIELIPVLYFSGANADPRRQAELELLYKEGIQFDLVNDAIPEAELIRLDELIDEYGQGILQAFGNGRLDYYRESDGSLYTLPSVFDYISSQGIAMRKDILDKYGIDATSIRDLSDLDALFESLAELEPDMALVCAYGTGTAFYNRGTRAQLVKGTLFCQSDYDPGLLVNYYATDEFKQIVSYTRKWYLAGYMPANMAIQNVSAASLVKTGKLFCFSSPAKPGIEYELSLSCGTEMVVVELMEPVISPTSVDLRYWGITQSCQNPGKAMKFMNLLYTDAELINLLMYGIEGEHYEIQPDGTIDYPDGVTGDTVGYVNAMPWLIPNMKPSYVWSGNDPDLWEKTESYCESAKISDLLGFTFDDSAVSQEHARLNSIVSEYYYGLASGLLDPDIYLVQMLERMENAGLALVQAEIQSQFTEWLASKER